MNLHYLIHLANYSDGVLYILGLMLLVELAVMVDRFWYLRRTILRGLVFVQELGRHGRLDREALNTLAEDAGDLP
ncbi:MAG: MotA/TolQ/ExbB proton channel family protein, partial [Acidithiobacillus thiooxidans]